MFLNRILSNSRHLLSKKPLPLETAGILVRQSHYFKAVKARTPPSAGEITTYWVGLMISMWFYPLWVFYYLPEYQQEDRNVYTGK